MERLTFSHIAWDTWVAGKLGFAAISHSQQRKLRELVEFARVHSPYYADRYRDLPVFGVQHSSEVDTDLQRLILENPSGDSCRITSFKSESQPYSLRVSKRYWKA